MPQRAEDASPNYVDLVRFLIEPFLESSNSLSLDCEKLNGNERIWIRLAFGDEEKGRVFGRGGRNIQAIRTVIQAAAQAAGQSVYLDIYDESAEGKSRSEPSNGGRFVARRNPPRPPSRPSKPEPRPRF